MEFYFHSLSDKPYAIASPEKIATPRLLLFYDRLQHNLNKMKALLDATAPGFGLESIWPHVKTHKSVWVTKQLMQAGVRSFKSTPNEVDMLITSGVEAMFVAYPLVSNEAARIGKLAGENRHIRFFVQASHPKHIEYLEAAAAIHDVQWQYFIDLDVGMHRTGLDPQKAVDLYRAINGSGRFKFLGFHGYDGHNASPSLEDRRRTSKASIDLLFEVIRKFARENIQVPKLVMGGTPSFLTNLEYLHRIELDTDVILSPGTWVFSDTMTSAVLPQTFEVASCLLAQVMDRPATDTATLNLGYKRWSIDQGSPDCFSIQGMRALKWSEEHTVVSVPEGAECNIGDYILIAPKHVCSTVNLWEYFVVLNADGEIEIPKCPVDARNR